MNKVSLLVIGLIASLSASAHEAEGWLLVSKDGRQSLVYGSSTGFQQVALLGNVTIYDNAGPKIGVLSRDNGLRGGNLLIVDKQSHRIESSWPVYQFPATQLLGPTEDLLLTDSHAYFVSVRLDPEGNPLEPNALGGFFDLVRIDLQMGDTSMYTLPREMTNPRVTGVGGRLALFSGKNPVAWTFDDATQSVKLLGGRARMNVAKLIDDGVPDPSDKLVAGAIPGTLATLPDESRVFVDSGGVIHRVNKDGKAESLWNLSTLLPGTTPSLTRIIELN